MSRPVWTRRELLRLSAGALGVSAAARRAAGQVAPVPVPPLPPRPRVNGGINVQPLRTLTLSIDEILPDLIRLQLRAVYDLGFDGVRITAPLDRMTLLAAVPYVRAARALGIDALVILADFSGFALVQALADPRRRGIVLGAYDDVFGSPMAPATSAIRNPGRIAFQVLNEPARFLGLPPDTYVTRFLAPTFRELKRRDPELIVVSAAEVGTRDGAARIRVMLETGLEDFCDRIAYHVYDRDVIPALAANVTRLVWITESGVVGPENHLAWVRDVFPAIRAGIGDVSRIFYFQLFDLDPRRHRLLDIVADPMLGFRAVPESAELHAYWLGRVRDAEGGRPHAAFDALIPDIHAYFPTAQDVRAIDAALALA